MTAALAVGYGGAGFGLSWPRGAIPVAVDTALVTRFAPPDAPMRPPASSAGCVAEAGSLHWWRLAAHQAKLDELPGAGGEDDVTHPRDALR